MSKLTATLQLANILKLKTNKVVLQFTGSNLMSDDIQQGL